MESTAIFHNLGGPIFDFLLWNEAGGNLIPGVLLKWEMSPDATQWTLTVRPDMKWHNGDPVTAEDVAFSIGRIVSPAGVSGFAAIWKSSVDRVEVVSPTTALLKTKVPWPLFPYSASPRGGAEGAVVSSAYFKQVGEAEFRNKPVGSGPWKFVRHDFGIRYVYEVAPSKHPYRPQPGYKELEIVLAPEESTRIAALRTGTGQIVDASFDAVATLKGTPFQIVQVPTVLAIYAFFNGLDDPRMNALPTGKVAVRKALTLAIDRRDIIDTILGGRAELPPRHLVWPGVVGYDPSWKPTPYDPAEAKRLLTSAGYASGFTIQVTTASYPGASYNLKLVEAMTGYWSAVGVQAKITVTDVSRISAMWRQRPQSDQIVGGVVSYAGIVQAAPLAQFNSIYTSQSVVLLMGQRKEVDDLILQATAELDNDKRDQLIRHIVDVVFQEYVAVPLAVSPALFAVSPSVENWQTVRSAGAAGLTLETARPKR